MTTTKQVDGVRPSWLREDALTVQVTGFDPKRKRLLTEVDVPIGSRLLLKGALGAREIIPWGPCCYIALKQPSAIGVFCDMALAQLSSVCERMKSDIKNAADHFLNPLHVYCRAKDMSRLFGLTRLGVTAPCIRRLCNLYERKLYTPHIRPFTCEASGVAMATSGKPTVKKAPIQTWLRPVPIGVSFSCAWVPALR